MMSRLNARFVGAIGGASIFVAASLSAAPVTMEYGVTALGDPGRYEYRYTITNVSLAEGVAGFSLDFDGSLYDEATLRITTTGISGWSEQLLASVPIFSVPAQYDAAIPTASSLGIGDSLAGFSVAFTWLGSGVPGNQTFSVYDLATFNVLTSGQTQLIGDPPPNQVPEPATLVLALLALSGSALASLRRPRLVPTRP